MVVDVKWNLQGSSVVNVSCLCYAPVSEWVLVSKKSSSCTIKNSYGQEETAE